MCNIVIFQQVEIFSNVGGYLGIWLGISLFSLGDMLYFLFHRVNLWLRKVRSRDDEKRLQKRKEVSLGEEKSCDVEKSDVN